MNDIYLSLQAIFSLAIAYDKDIRAKEGRNFCLKILDDMVITERITYEEYNDFTKYVMEADDDDQRSF